jgi:two-component SAPR family response regulator
MQVKLIIHLLGDYFVNYNGQSLDGFGTVRLQSILAYLLLHCDIPQPRQRLAFLLWPNSSESSARNNLRQLIHQLRKALPDPDRFSTSDASTIGWKLDSDQTVDIIIMEQALAQAASAEKQQNPDIERTQAHPIEALHKLITLQGQIRDYAAAIHTGQVLRGVDPLDETLYIMLMRLLLLIDD